MLTRLVLAIALFTGFVSVLPACADTKPISDHALLMQLAASNAQLVQKVNADRAVIADLRSTVAAQQVKLNAVSSLALRAATVADAAQPASSTSYGPFTVSGKNVYLTDYNLHIQSGSGSTDGKVNGYGNLIIGYNEGRGSSGTDVHTGSHNLIIGSENNYSGYGAIVGGYYNTSSAPYASVTGGRHGTASGAYSSVSGGYGGVASGQYASVTGGGDNTAVGEYASVTGGNTNTARGVYASAFGGQNNMAAGDLSLAGGGFLADASGEYATCLGGDNSSASNYAASSFGGYSNQASGEFSSVTGGEFNIASGILSTVSGGASRTETNDDYWKAGTYESE